MKKHFFIIILTVLGYCMTIQGQVFGSISDESGEPLSFANVYVKNSTTGTTSNLEGEYELDLAPGNYELIYQYVGYSQKLEKVELGNSPLRLDVILEEESVGLQEVVVTVDGEDPAYAIIRKARDKRKYYLGLVDEYACDVYMKGNQRVADVPDKFMGIEIGDMGGVLDTTGSGIVYLSESVSKLSYQKPDNYKEKMISSKVSGNDNGFSFNQASAMDFNFYKESYSLGRNIVSPIAGNCFNYYQYKLEGAFVDEYGNLINKIQVKRKRDTDPALNGHIYITEDLWNIHSLDLWTDGDGIGIDILDTIRIKEVNVPVEGPDKWLPISRVVDFKLKIFFIQLEGEFTAVYSKYDLNPNFPKGTFGAEVLNVEEEANQRDSSYWEAIRPVPLSDVEQEDYIKKDSLQKVWSSKEYLDSMDRKNNKFKVMDLLFGYSFSNSYKKWRISVDPLSSIQFNTVQGYYPYINGSFRKTFDSDRNRWLDFQGGILYGIADKQVRGKFGGQFNFDQVKYTRIGIEGGRMAVQFNEEEPIAPLINTLTSVIFRRNYAKLYDKYYGRATFRQELFNGLFLTANLEYAHRKPLRNHSDYSFFYREDRDFTSNDPIDTANFDGNAFAPHEALTIDLTFRIRPGQKYLTYPNRKFIAGSKYPTFYFNYKRGIPILGGDTNFDFVSLAMTDNFGLGVWGNSDFRVEGGMFLSDESVPFIDHHHFNGNRNFLLRVDNYTDRFKWLPYYEASTTNPYFKAHWEHNFEGVILGKVPGIRKLKWYLTTGANFLYTEDLGPYTEVSVGLDNIGFKVFRILRFDFTTAFRKGENPDFGFILGLKL